MAKTTYQITMQDEATKVLRDLATSVKGLQKDVEGLAAVESLEILGQAWEKISGVVTASITAYADAERQATKLNAVLDATGNTTGFTRRALQEMTDQMQRQTGIDGDMVKGAEAVLGAYKNLQGDGFRRTLNISADLAKFWDGDMVAAAKNLGTMLEKPSEAFGKLKKQGVVLDDALESTVKRFEDLGDITSAQNVLLGELEKRYGGTAQAMRKDLQGSIDAAETAFGDLQERIGQGFAPAAQAGLEILREVMEVISSLPPGVVAGATAFGTLAVGIPLVVTALGKARAAAMAFGLTMQSTAGIVGLAIGAIAAVAIAISNQSDQAAKDVEDMADRTVTAYKNILDVQRNNTNTQVRLSQEEQDKLNTRIKNTNKEIEDAQKKLDSLNKKSKRGYSEGFGMSDEGKQAIELKNKIEALTQSREADAKALVFIQENTKKVTAADNANAKAAKELATTLAKNASDAVDAYLQKLRDEYATLGLSEVAKLKYEKALKDATKEQKKEAAELTRKIELKKQEIEAEAMAAAAVLDAKRSVDDQIGTLKTQIATIGLTTEQLAEYEAGNLAAALSGNEEYQKKIQALKNLAKVVAQLTRDQELAAKAAALIAQNDPTVERDKELADAQELLNKGLISQEIYTRAASAAWKKYDDAVKKAKETVDEMPQALKDLGEAMPFVSQALQNVMSVVNSISQVIQNVEQARTDAMLQSYDLQLDALEKSYQAQLALAEANGEDTVQIESDYANQKEALERSKAEAQDAAARKAFETNKAMSLANAIVNTAVATTSAISMQPFPIGLVMAPLVAAAGAAEIAVIASQQYTPQLAEGGIIMPRAGGTLVNAGEANWPEAVIPLKNGLGDLGVGGGRQISINIERINGTADKEFARILAKEIRNLDRRNAN